MLPQEQISEYEQIRLKNIEQRESYFKSLNLQQHRETVPVIKR